eukprot:6722-Pyramimonas_sp.AAC.1
MGRGARAPQSALIYLLAVSGPAGGAKKRQRGQEGAKMAQERSKRAQDRTKAFQNFSTMA